MGEMNNLHICIEELNNEILEFIEISSGLKSGYQSISTELQRSYVESELFWCNWAVGEKKRLSEETGTKLSRIDDTVNGLDSIEQQLCRVDRSYEKRYTNTLQKTLPIHPIQSESTDFDIQVRDIFIEAKQIADECSLTSKHEVFQELFMKFSDKRFAKYERLNTLIRNAHQVRKVAFDYMMQNLIKQHEDIEQQKTEGINTALEETASLIQKVEVQYQVKLKQTDNECSLKLKNLISAYDIKRMNIYNEKIRIEGDLPLLNRDQVLIGELEHDLSMVSSTVHVLKLLNSYFGEMLSDNFLRIPSFYSLMNNLNICFNTTQANKSNSENAIHSIIFTLLRNQPASRQHFILADTEGRSKGFNIFLEFYKNHSDIIGDRILTSKNQIRDKLSDLCSYIDEMGQTKFVGYHNIIEYNKVSEDKQEPLQCLCVLDFPKHFDECMLTDLYYLVKNGSAFGVSVILQYCIDLSGLEYSEKTSLLINQICSSSDCLFYEDNKWKYLNGTSICLNDTPTLDEIRKLDEVFSIQKEELSNSSLPISRILPETEWYAGTSADILSIPIGKNENGSIQALEFGDIVGNGTSHYALVVGSIGSGKSTLLHTVIMNTITKYSPDEVQLYLMDFKSGTEFKIYSEIKMPHIKVLALDAMQEFGQSILDKLWEIIEERSRLFKELLSEKINIKDITQYRKVTGKKMPRILVIADEFQMLFSEDNNRSVAQISGMRMADLISLARVYGIHFVLATQTLSRLSNGFSIRKSTLNEMHVRIGLQCTEYESSLLFGEINGKKAFNKMGLEKGMAVYIDNDVRGIPIGFKVAYCNQETQDTILRKVSKRYSILEAKEKTIVFTGDSVPHINNCEGFNNPDPNECLDAVKIYLGEPIKIASPVTIKVSRMKRNNLLIAGNNQKMLENLISIYVMNAIKTHPYIHPFAPNKSVYFIDGLSVLGEGFSDLIKTAISFSPSDINIAKDNFDAITFVNELYEIYDMRRSNKIERKNSRHSFNTIHLVINNFQWVESMNLLLSNHSISEYNVQKDNNTEDDLFGHVFKNHINDKSAYLDDLINNKRYSHNSSEISVYKKIMTLIDNGYVYGINVVLGATDYQSIKPILYDVLSKFPNKIIFSMNNNEAYRIIPDANTERLRSNIVLFSDGINQSYQFKPFNFE